MKAASAARKYPAALFIAAPVTIVTIRATPQISLGAISLKGRLFTPSNGLKIWIMPARKWW
jgi:hypothetical protein